MPYSAVQLYLAPPSPVTSGCKKTRGRRPKAKMVKNQDLRRPNQDGDGQNAKLEIYKTVVPKPMGDVTVTTSTSCTVYSLNLLIYTLYLVFLIHTKKRM